MDGDPVSPGIMWKHAKVMVMRLCVYSSWDAKTFRSSALLKHNVAASSTVSHEGPKEEVFGDARVPLWRRFGGAVEPAEEPVEGGDKGGDHVVSLFTEKILLVRNVAY